MQLRRHRSRITEVATLGAVPTELPQGIRSFAMARTDYGITLPVVFTA